jgi:hypothetical protein
MTATISGDGTSTLISLTTSGNTILGDASTDTLNVGNGGLVKDASGNVGIGTSSPAAPLDVVSNSSALGFLVRGRSSDNIGKMSFANNANSTTYATIQAYSGEFSILGVANAPTVFYTNNTERMRIDSSGNLGVGTTSPGYRLDAVSGAATAARFYVSGASDTADAAIRVAKAVNDSTTSNRFVIFTINSDNAGSGQINANGASAAAFGSFSDSRLKENIVDLPSQLANIMALRPVEYDYIESEGGGHQIGFIAQEVQEIYPDLIGEREDGMLTLTDMNKNDARLIKAIQEQQALIVSMREELDALKTKVGA